MQQRRTAKAKAVATQGIKTFEEKNYKQALQIFEEAISYDDELPIAWYYKGLVLKEFKRYTEAITAMTKATDVATTMLNPGDADRDIKVKAFTEKGHILSKIGCYVEAVELFFLLEQQGFNIPGLKTEMANLRAKGGVMEGLEGRSYLQTDDYQKAIISFKTSLKKNPRDKYVCKMLGETLEKSKNYREAMKIYLQAIELGEDEIGLLYNQAICLCNMKNHRRAKTCLDKFLETNPNHMGAKKLRLECMAAIERGEAKDRDEEDTPIIMARKAEGKRKQLIGWAFVFFCFCLTALYWFTIDWRLMLSLNSKNARTKNMSIYQLGQRKNTNAINKLIEILDSKDEEPNVRATAALALGDLEAREALKSLINALQDQNWNVRCCAAKSLGLMKSDEAVQPMGNILKRDIYYLVRINVVEALASIKGPAAINILLKVGLKDENPYVKKAVVNQFRNNIADSNLVVLPLCELLKDQDKSVREETAITLGELKNKKALTPLKKALQVKDEPVQVQQAIRGAINNINQN